MHLEKQKIFDEYAIRKGHKNWQTMQEVYVVDMNQEILEDANGLMNSYMVHVMAACDLVQKAQQGRIAGFAKVKNERKYPNGSRYGVGSYMEYSVDRESIKSEKNLIK